MEWVLLPLVGIFLLVVFAPLVMLLGTFFVLVPLAHLAPAGPSVANITFQCPVSKRTVGAAFLTAAGADHPSDVLSCTLFADGHVRCKKGCLDVASTGWAPSPMVPRYALVSDGAAFR